MDYSLLDKETLSDCSELISTGRLSWDASENRWCLDGEPHGIISFRSKGSNVKSIMDFKRGRKVNLSEVYLPSYIIVLLFRI